MRKLLIPIGMCLFNLPFTPVKAQFVQNEFIIGASYAPSLVQETATPAPANYDGDINNTIDLASRINSGPNQGKFQIDYATNANFGFNPGGWTFITASNIYGGAGDFVVPGKYTLVDNKADIAVYFPATKQWKIDYSGGNFSSFGSWDIIYDYSSAAGLDATAIPVPADYDGDGITDIAFKTSAGNWLIDYSTINGFGQINFTRAGCGGVTAHPVPADYDGPNAFEQRKADISVKTDAGEWKIDYAENGFNGWDVIVTNCGGSDEIPVPADYNGDERAELGLKNSNGGWKYTITYTNNSPVVWGPSFTGYGGIEAVPYAGDFNGDGKADFSFAFTNDGRWWIDNPAVNSGGYEWISSPGKVAGDFNQNVINPADIQNYQRLKECNVNLTVDGPTVLDRQGNNYDNKRNYYLSLMNHPSVNLKTMLSDPFISNFGNPLSPGSFNINQFANQYANNTTYAPLAPNLKDRIYAINLGDEPTNVTAGFCGCVPFTSVGAWSSFFQNQTPLPVKPTFNNLLPIYYYTSNAEINYGTYLDQYRSISNSPFVSFDHYPFRNIAFDNSYFTNLSMVKSKFMDRSMISTIWSAGNITDPQLQFSAFCPVAYGAKGIVYFPYANLTSSFTGALASDNVKYGYVKNINNYLKNIVGPVTIGCTNIATLHKLIAGTNYTGTPGTSVSPGTGYVPPANEIISNYTGIVENVNNSDVLIGVFAKNCTTTDPKVLNVGYYYLWIVNKNTNEGAANIEVILRGNFGTGTIQVSPRMFNYAGSTTYTAVTPVSLGNNLTKFTIPVLNGGEGIMVKLFSSENEGVPADYDGDKIMDISVKTYNGTWLIDYSGNGYGNWDWWGTGYGDQTSHPVPADYNGDGRADISVKKDNGSWFIDYSSATAANNGYNGWEFITNPGTYGGIEAIPVPADYNGDKRADLSVKVNDGRWLIDYSSATAPNNGFSGWEFTNSPGTYGLADARPVPADYNGDGRADISVKKDNGSWLIDYSNPTAPNNGFAGWEFITSAGTYGGVESKAVPANYGGAVNNTLDPPLPKADLSVKVDDGRWLVDYATNAALPGNGFSGWEVSPPVTPAVYGNQTAVALPGDYGGDGLADMSIKYPNGDWKIDYSVNGFTGFDNIILKPVTTQGLGARSATQNVTIPVMEAQHVCLVDENKNYFIATIFDQSGRVFLAINQNTTLKVLKHRNYFPAGIYFIKIVDKENVCTAKIFIGR